jgi:hypothetical protein
VSYPDPENATGVGAFGTIVKRTTGTPSPTPTPRITPTPRPRPSPPPRPS